MLSLLALYGMIAHRRVFTCGTPTMTPADYYEQAIAQKKIQEDAQQARIIHQLTKIAASLEKRNSKKPWSVFKKKPVRGLYLWGKVGIGKTFLIDCFYQAVAVPKRQQHFHAFMQDIHRLLKTVQGHKNPLQLIAKQIAREVRVLCFDEFQVFDIGDAMILGELLRNLFAEGVTLMTSSNTTPDLLYKEGLQRERFLPAIELIKRYTEVIHLHSNQDYRRQQIAQAGVFYTPLNSAAQENLKNAFIYFSQNKTINREPIMLCNREVPIVCSAGSVIWLSFETLCGQPRSQNDYLALTQQFRTVLIEGLRRIQSHEIDRLLLFVYLIDILYDARCRVVCSSAVPVTEIYTGEKHQDLFSRTLSRLIEMQSEKYVYREIIGEEFTGL